MNRVCPSLCLSGRFLGIVSLVFSKFWYDARNPYKVVRDRAGFSRIFFFCLRNWESGPKMDQKQGFLNKLKNFVINFYWICSIMKMYNICYVPAQIPYLGKFCSQPIRSQDLLINHISRTNQSNSLIFCMLIQIQIWYRYKLKVDQKNFGLAWPEMGVASWSQDSKIGCISRINWCNELIFCMVVQIQKSKKLFQRFLGGLGQKWAWSFNSWDPKICWISLWIELIFCMLTVMQ